MKLHPRPDRTRRTICIATVALGTVLLLAAATAQASGDPLVAEAGGTQVALDGEAIQTDGLAFGGQPPYTFAWSFDGSDARFEDPSKARTTFDTSGLASGDVTLTLEVTDATGTAVTDTVVHHINRSRTLLDRSEQAGRGVPDEFVGESGTVDGQTRTFAFDVPAGLGRLEAVLDWDNDRALLFNNDFDFELVRPDGESATGSQGRTGDRPERVAVSDPIPGTWTVRVEPWLTQPATFHVTVTGLPDAPVPDVRTGGSYTFGTEDRQEVVARIRGGVDPAGAWDLDLDGTYETSGTTGTLDLSPGDTASVAYKATDAATGYEARGTASVEVLTGSDRVLELGCDDNPWRPTTPMEFTASKGTCWLHGGHNTYYLGDAFTLDGGDASVFSVEQQFSPPTEAEVEPGGLGADAHTPVHVEVSLDGRTWSEIGAADYELVDVLKDCFLCLDTRQRIFFSLPAHDEPFRFVRFHQPPSAARGLSGFLDRSRAQLRLDEASVAPGTTGAGGQATRSLDCRSGDLLEDLFPEHPCTFGGQNRWDTPSFFHTYPLAVDGSPAQVDAVSGSFVVEPWRKDDFWIPLDVGETLQGNVSQLTETRVFVQTSADGVRWRTVGTVDDIQFETPTSFSVDVDPDRPARFVRLFPDHHPRFEDFRQQPSLHHPEAFFRFSELAVSGVFAS